MKITGGRLRGLKLFSPKGEQTRPMTERVRKALFDVLGQNLEGLRVLDLFSGTGALGIEALSRGAKEVVFAEASPQMVAVIRANLKQAGLLEKAQVFKAWLPKDLRRLPAGPYDLIFVTPPYGKGLAQKTLKALPLSFLAPQGLLVVEERKQTPLGEKVGPWVLREKRVYGDTVLYFYER